MRPGSDCGSDHELIIAKLWLKLKKVGTTTKPFWYDCNQIPYDYTGVIQMGFKSNDRFSRMSEAGYLTDR